ncbi:TPA: hypothetical protein N0F65_011892 [Lagenidium giganteum]|uniref:Uncharacterized protein n=1 Tax=Lagenidium giganteum TaxID=4803 RepID=A0AAV2YEK8_9STRA|nr:TPA: hypothetical protein N0F65_011892 [Lagenidium giganteum]
MCTYRKGSCHRPRTFRRDGRLHTLCAFHRAKSIRNQKLFDGRHKKRAR